MKIKFIISAIALLSGFSALAQDWPNNAQFIYFGSPNLDQTTSTINYALIQHKTEGRVFLNSPTTLTLRLANVDKLALDNTGFTFKTGFVNLWPVDGRYTYFGSTSLNQSNPENYAVLQNRTSGTTSLNSPVSVSLSLKGAVKAVLDSTGFTLKTGFNNPWPVDGRYTYFGSATLDQTLPGNYALIQNRTTGTTALNSPISISFSINNQSKAILDNNGFTFKTGFDNLWPVNNSFTYFGSIALDQTLPGNYALLQSRTSGLTCLNSPTSISFRINNADKMVLTQEGKIAINKTTAAYTLDVAGTINATQILVNGQPISSSTGGPYAGPWTVASTSINYTEGQVGIGTAEIPEEFKLAVQGKIIAEGVKVEMQSDWPDYVFSTGYKLRSLKEVEAYISVNNHLPEIPSSEEVKRNGLDLGEMNARLLQKIEELTLYQIELLKKLEEQEQRIQSLEDKAPKNANGDLPSRPL